MTYNLGELLEAAVDGAGDRVALVVGDRRLTYRELDERVNRFAHHLTSVGIGPGDHVGLHLSNCSAYVEAMFAAWKLRAVPVNINYRYVERELRYLYEDAGLAAVVYHRRFSDRVAAVAPDIALVVDDGSDDEAVPGSTPYEEAVAGSDPTRPEVADRSGDDLYITYTGGTTGMPKGVVWRHEDIFKAAMGGGDLAQQGDHVRDADELRERVATSDHQVVALATPPLMHASAQWLTCHQFFTGGRVVMTENGVFDPPTIWELVEREGVLILVVVGDAMAKPLLDELAAGDHDASSCWIIASSGAVLSDASKARLLELLPDRTIVDSFGSSETGVLGPRDQDGGAFQLNEWTAVLGDDGRPVEPGSGQRGRLARRGHVPLRYLNDPEKSAETFIEIDGERWALIGDEATVDEDGRVRVLGRGSQSINTGGEKVYPEEVEAALKEHDAVDDVLVVGVPDERWGERVVAVAQLRSQLTLDALQEHARERLAGYKVPRDLVVVDRVERSPAGKPDYQWAKRAATGETVGG